MNATWFILQNLFLSTFGTVLTIWFITAVIRSIVGRVNFAHELTTRGFVEGKSSGLLHKYRTFSKGNLGVELYQKGPSSSLTHLFLTLEPQFPSFYISRKSKNPFPNVLLWTFSIGTALFHGLKRVSLQDPALNKIFWVQMKKNVSSAQIQKVEDFIRSHISTFIHPSFNCFYNLEGKLQIEHVGISFVLDPLPQIWEGLRLLTEMDQKRAWVLTLFFDEFWK